MSATFFFAVDWFIRNELRLIREQRAWDRRWYGSTSRKAYNGLVQWFRRELGAWRALYATVTP